jgi:cell division protein FtsI/penicillin-binding protein 2
MLDAGSRSKVTRTGFATRLQAAANTATERSVKVVRVGHVGNGVATIQMAVRTRLWGTLDETLRLPLTGSGSAARVHLQSSMLFPGLDPGQALRRHTRLPTRGTLLADDKEVLAAGRGRLSPQLSDITGEIVGSLEPMPPDETAHYSALGYPPGTKVGLNGLEHIFQKRLAGTPGGTLKAGSRVLARAQPVKAKPVHTTIDPTLERAAVAAIAGGFDPGIAAMNPHTGAVEALAGIAFSAPQPPGSTMKIVTATAALQSGLVKLDTAFPYASEADVGGYTLQNAGGEVCGGTLINAFAVSCNSVFAPLGVKVGAKRLVATARRFGFDHRSSILGAAEPTIPSAKKIGGDTAVGSSAIGQGEVLSTPLEMTDVAATIADGGRRPIPTLRAGAKPRFVHVTSPKVAGEVQQMMEAVVSYGTGTPAQIPGVVVAGKTGTAELTDTGTSPANGEQNNPNANNPKNTDAWFVGYAPAGHPKVVVGALFPNAGAGAATAAPPVRDTIETALEEK